MNFNKISIFVATLLLFATSACEPIEERVELKNSFDPEKIELKVVQATPGGNKLSLQMNTPGVVGYWDYGIDKKFSDRVEVNYPIPGKHTFTYYVTNGFITQNDKGFSTTYVQKTIDVQIDKLDAPIPEAYVKLVGTDFNNGKTWVFDRSNPSKWWYMTDSDWTAFWWQPDTNADINGKMVFDLNGAANFKSYSTPSSSAVNGKWAFNSDFTKLTISGDANILGIEGGGVNNAGSKTFDIKELTADRLILFQNNMAWSPGWVWVFKAQ